jgi:hypothetical protein
VQIGADAPIELRLALVAPCLDCDQQWKESRRQLSA